jgi:hypothetical protein
MTNRLFLALSVDQALFIEKDILGYKRDVVGTPSAWRIELPNASRPETGSIGLLAPSSAPSLIGAHLEEGWGLQSETQSYAEVYALLLILPIPQDSVDKTVDDQAREELLANSVEIAYRWFDSLAKWLWILTAQALDPANPDPKVFHRSSSNIVIALSDADNVSRPAITSPRLTLRIDIDSPTSERLVDQRVFDLAVTMAGTPPPLMWELLAAGRMAGRRGDARRALVDAGTAAEAALRILLALPPQRQLTLGGLVKEALDRGIALPADTYKALVDPRNQAIHKGVWSLSKVHRALEISEELVGLADPKFIRSSSLHSVNRPQRQDIRFIRNG